MPTVLGRASARTGEDPFGPGDPLEVARLVRRALADAGRKAAEVSTLVVVTDADVPSDRRDRFVRRALGPHAERIEVVQHVVDAVMHSARKDHAIGVASATMGSSVGPVAKDALVVMVVLGPGDQATALCLG